jgi:hypothetical protein
VMIYLNYIPMSPITNFTNTETIWHVTIPPYLPDPLADTLSNNG